MTTAHSKIFLYTYTTVKYTDESPRYDVIQTYPAAETKQGLCTFMPMSVCVYIVISPNRSVFMPVAVHIDIIPLQPDIRYYFYLHSINNINMPA
jgi:hypothetical protein